MREFFLNWPGDAMFWAIPAALSTAIVILYFLKLRRARKTVASTMLWKKSVEDLRVNAPFQRLRRNILLFLQLLILLLLIASFYRPWFSGSELKVPSAVILIDNSASMNARESGMTRLEIAKEKATALIDTLNEGVEGGREIMIISFSNRSRVALPFSSDVSELKRSLDTIEGTDATTSLDDALSIAVAALSQKPEPKKVYVISDGAFPPAAKTRTGNAAQIEFIGIGGPASNIAITAFDVRSSPETFEEFQVFATAENFSSKPFSGSIDVYFNGRVIDSAALDIPAGGSISKTFGDYRLGEGVVSVKIDAKDDLSSDDSAYQELRPRKKYTALLVAEGAANYFLERLFAAEPRAELKVMSIEGFNSDVGPDGAQSYDLVIFDRVRPARIGAGNFIFICSAPPISGFKTTGKSEGPWVLFSDSTHPVMNMVTFDNVRMNYALDAALPQGAAVLVEASNGPLVAAVFEKDTRVIYIGFDIFESTWPLKSSFPVFMMGALRYLADLSRSQNAIRISAGNPVTLRGPAGKGDINVTVPSGRVLKVPVSESGIAEFADTWTAGIYEVESSPGARSNRFAVNLLDADESKLEVRPAFKVGETEVAATRKKVDTSVEIWKYLAVAALVFLFVEWYVYNRKVRI